MEVKRLVEVVGTLVVAEAESVIGVEGMSVVTGRVIKGLVVVVVVVAEMLLLG